MMTIGNKHDKAGQASMAQKKDERGVKRNASAATLKKVQQMLYECWMLDLRVQQIPDEIEAKKNALKNRKAHYLSAMEQIRRVNDYIKDNRSRLDDAVKRREEAEEKLERVSTQREFDVENAIAESCKKEEHKIHLNISNLEKRREAVLAKAREMEEEIAGAEQSIGPEIEALEKELVEKKALRDKAMDRRRKASAKIDENLLYKFERIIRNKGGLASVSLKSGICQGCHMQLPDQFVNTVRENKEIQFCPYCSRILVYEESREDEEIIESNAKYKDKRQSEEDEQIAFSQQDLEQEASGYDEDDGEAGDDDSALKDEKESDDEIEDMDEDADMADADLTLIADESEFDL